MIETIGKLKFYTNWCVVELDPEIGKYYRVLCPKSWYIQIPLWPLHITVVRKNVEQIQKKEKWGLASIPIIVRYNPVVRRDKLYAWLDCFSPQIEEIRLGLGLPRFRFDCYHITIGNFKEN